MEKSLEQLFIQTLRNHLVTLPFDLNLLYEAKDDPNFDRAVRETMCGGIIYILHPQDPGTERYVSRSDDVVVLRILLDWLRKHGGEGVEQFSSRFSEIYETLDRDLDVYRRALGDTFTWLESKLATLPKQVHKSKKVQVYLDDEEEAETLYEDGLEFRTNYEITEEQIEGRLKQSKPILDYLIRKKQLDAMRIG